MIECGVTTEQVAKGEFVWGDLGTAFEIARCFGQDPIEYARKLAHEPEWMVDLLALYVTLRDTKDKAKR